MLRPVLFIHRWLGVIIGAVMTIWCLSGFVMMYVDYPRLMPYEQVRGLAPLRLPEAQAFDRVTLTAETLLISARMEMMSGRPVLRIERAVDPGRPITQMRSTPGTFDIATGRPLRQLSATEAHGVAITFGRQSDITGPPGNARATGMDQWTVQTFRSNQPLYRVDYADPEGSTIYVAGNSGEVVQRTTRFERFWGWLGAVPHWLYPTILRHDGALWSQVVIWTSLVGCFLTVTGLWVGIARLRRRRDGSIGSPYRGLWWWHHVSGLVFGVMALAWVASGLFSMNPWGLLDSMAGFAENRQLAGEPRWSEVRAAMARLRILPPGTVRVESAALAGQTFLIATNAEGRILRFDARGNAAPLGREELMSALARLPGATSLEWINSEDSYYYAHRFPVKLPVWRGVLSDGEATRLYIDPDSGRIIRALDANGRRYRWLQNGLHSLDLPILRTRPLWDIVVLPLLAAVTLICATGTWMGLRRLRRDVGRIRRRWLRS